MVAWTTESALFSKRFEKVLLSTDSHQIAKIGIGYAAEVPFFRDRDSDVCSPSSEVIFCAFDQEETKEYWA